MVAIFMEFKWLLQKGKSNYFVIIYRCTGQLCDFNEKKNIGGTLK